MRKVILRLLSVYISPKTFCLLEFQAHDAASQLTRHPQTKCGQAVVGFLMTRSFAGSLYPNQSHPSGPKLRVPDYFYKFRGFSPSEDSPLSFLPLLLALFKDGVWIIHWPVPKKMSQSPTEIRPRLLGSREPDQGNSRSVDPDPSRSPGHVQQRSRGACDACRARKVKVSECATFSVVFVLYGVIRISVILDPHVQNSITVQSWISLNVSSATPTARAAQFVSNCEFHARVINHGKGEGRRIGKSGSES